MAPTDSEKDDDGRDVAETEPTGVQKAVLALSGLFVLLLLGYAGWQILAGPSQSTPEARVVDTAQLEDGRVEVTVELRNQRDHGLVSATVETDCSDPPTEIEFTYVPAHDRREGTVVCPANTSEPRADIVSWVSR